MSPTTLPSRAPLQRYSGAETRFDGFPDPARFSPEFGEAQFRAAARQTNDDPAPRLLSLHLRLPFDPADTAASAGPGRSRAYVHRLARECAIVAPLFDRERDVVQLQLDGLGGELPGDLPGELLHAVSRRFLLNRSDTREFLIALPASRAMRSWRPGRAASTGATCRSGAAFSGTTTGACAATWCRPCCAPAGSISTRCRRSTASCSPWTRSASAAFRFR